MMLTVTHLLFDLCVQGALAPSDAAIRQATPEKKLPRDDDYDDDYDFKNDAACGGAAAQQLQFNEDQVGSYDHSPDEAQVEPRPKRQRKSSARHGAERD